MLDEVQNKHSEMVLLHTKNLNNAIKDLNRLSVSLLPLINVDNTVSKEKEEYADFIEMFLIESGITIAEMYPAISHKEVVKQALQRKKPFKSDGKDSYRDYLVWQTFLQ